MTAVLFVCTGNICRSPTAEGVFRKQLETHGLSELVTVDSAGTGSWHRPTRDHARPPPGGVSISPISVPARCGRRTSKNST
jgi:hypothetical protein